MSPAPNVSRTAAQQSHTLMQPPAQLCRGPSSSKTSIFYQSNLVASLMLLQSLRALCLAPGGSASILKYLEAQVRWLGISWSTRYCFQTNCRFTDMDHMLQLSLTVHSISDTKCLASMIVHGLRVHIDRVTTNIQRFRGISCSFGKSDREYIFISRSIVRHHLISISSYFPTTIQTLSFPTIGLTWSIGDFVNPRNSVNYHYRELSNLPSRL